VPHFSDKSDRNLNSCHHLLQRLMDSVIIDYDFSVICGHRGEKEQNEAHSMGNSKLKWPKSKHNSMPSLAVDIVPYPLDWKNISSFKALAVEVKKTWDKIPEAEREGFDLSWGGDWKTFKDYPHYELRKKKDV